MTDDKGGKQPSVPEKRDEAGNDKPTPATPGAQPEKRFRKASKAELDSVSFMVGEPRSAIRTRLSGGSIGSFGGDSVLIGGAIRHIGRTLRELADHYRAAGEFISNPVLRNLAWGQSVDLDFEISPDEEVQLAFDGTRHSPTIDAADALGRLLRADPEELFTLGVELPDDAVAAYKQLLDVLSGEGVESEWQVPSTPEEIALVSSTDAAQDFLVLDREGDRQTTNLEVPGRLTMADSDLLQFALTLPSTLTRPPLLKGKHRVRGTYSPDVGARLKEQGLWDSDVIATIAVTYDLPGSTAIPRDHEYVLLDAERAIGASPSA